MNFETLKKAAAKYDAVVVDSNDPEAVNVTAAAASFDGEVFLWTASRLRFNNRENQQVLQLVNKSPAWETGSDYLLVCSSAEIFDALVNPAPEPPPAFPTPVEPEPEPEPEDDGDDDPPSLGFDRFSSWGE